MTLSQLPNDPRKNPGIKRAYYPLPVEDPDAWRCIEIHIPDGTEYHELLITALKSLTIWFNYMRDETHRGKVIADRFAYALNLPELGCDMNCEELTACLQPFFDALTASLDAQTAQLQQLIDTQTANAAADRDIPQSSVPDEICGAATAVVEFMDGFNQDLYTKAELSSVDNANEAIARIISAIPLFNELPFDELFALSNTMFENQVVAYTADFATARDALIQSLNCRIKDNADVFDYDLWSVWLDAVEAEITDNAAAKLFARYSPLRQTFINQIAAFFNKNASLQSYFDQVSTAYSGGLLNPVIGCDDCPTVVPLWRIITPGGFAGGEVTTVNHYDGTFTITARAIAGTDGTYRLAFNDANLSCWQVLEVTYDRSPEYTDANYDCGSTAEGADYTPGSAAGPWVVDACYGGIIASDLAAGWIVTAKIQLCP